MNLSALKWRGQSSAPCQYPGCTERFELTEWTPANRKYCTGCALKIKAHHSFVYKAIRRYGSVEAALAARAARPQRQQVSHDVIEGEVWRWVVGYEGLYRVSDHGRVYSVRTGMMISKTPLPTGYSVDFSCDGKHTKRSVSLLVLKAFRPRAHAGRYQALHLNGDVYDNRLSNLEWQVKNAKLSEDAIPEIWALWYQGWTYKQIAALYGVVSGTIAKVICCNSWTHIDESAGV